MAFAKASNKALTLKVGALLFSIYNVIASLNFCTSSKQTVCIPQRLQTVDRLLWGYAIPVFRGIFDVEGDESEIPEFFTGTEKSDLCPTKVR